LFFFRFLFLQWEWRCVTFRSITFRFWKNSHFDLKRFSLSDNFVENFLFQSILVLKT
jgi:hypothetical protein